MIDRLRPVRGRLGGNPRSCPPPCGEWCAAGGKRSVVSTRLTGTLTRWLGALKRHCCLRFNRGINPLATAGWLRFNRGIKPLATAGWLRFNRGINPLATAGRLRFNRGINPLATLGWQGGDWVYPRIRFEGGGAARSCISAHRCSAGGKRSVVSTRKTSALTAWLGALKRHCCLRFNRGINPLATAGCLRFNRGMNPLATAGWLRFNRGMNPLATAGKVATGFIPGSDSRAPPAAQCPPMPRDCAERNQPLDSFIHRPAEDTDRTL